MGTFGAFGQVCLLESAIDGASEVKLRDENGCMPFVKRHVGSETER